MLIALAGMVVGMLAVALLALVVAVRPMPY
jgi:tetrahydromethanopterin S-methyltransferase subunit B